MSLSANIYDVVYRRTRQDGQQMTLTTSGSNNGTYNPATGTYTATPQTYTVWGIPLEMTFLAFGTKAEGNSLIQQADKRVLLDGKDLPIKIEATGFNLTFNNQVWRVISVKEINLTGNYSVMYDLIVRK